MENRRWITDLEQQMARITEMMDYVPALVRQARLAGASWTEIGNALGVTRQAAQQRYSGVEIDLDEFGTKPIDL
jgi:hypothetical protein